MIVVAVMVLLSVLVYAAWRAKYGYPPSDVPQAICYHKISKEFCMEGTWVTPSRFFSQLDYLLGQGYTFIDENEFLKLLDHPSEANKSKLLLTFDDGYREILELAMPGLRERKIPALVFLVAGYAGKDNKWDLSLGRRPFRHLSWQEVRELSGNGFSFGSHGFTHSDLTALSPEESMAEIVRSKSMIEEELQAQVKSFSYPFGRYNSEVREMVAKAGYRAGFSLYPSHANSLIDRFSLRRNAVYIIDSPTALKLKLQRGPLFWLEDMKCRSINGVSVLTPLLKNFYSRRDK